MSGGVLNRLSWLRTSPEFTNTLISSHPATRWIAFRAGAPLIAHRTSAPSSHAPAYLSTADVRPLLGQAPFVGQGEHAGEGGPAEADVPSVLQSARFFGAPLVFLGVHEAEADSPPIEASNGVDPVQLARALKGVPYFSIDVSSASQGAVDVLVRHAATRYEGAEVAFADARAVVRELGAFDASVFAGARSMIDWNARNKVCRLHR